MTNKSKIKIKITSNGITHLEAEYKLCDLANKAVQISEKIYDFVG